MSKHSFREVVGALRRYQIVSESVLVPAIASANSSLTTLVATLLKGGRITRYQAKAIRKGNVKGLVLGDYLLLEQIGSGGMGVVFKANHRRMDRLVALKVLSPEVADDLAAIKRFGQEIRLAAKIDSPFVVRSYDAGKVGGLHYFVSEFIDGSDCQEAVRTSGPMSIGRAIRVIHDAARGLGDAHSAGIIHRDVKPSNLLLGRDGGVKVLDLGIAGVASSLRDSTQDVLTRNGAVMGTIDYMSPEQAEDTRTVTPAADVYSLGCTLFYLLTGRRPFARETFMKTVLAHREDLAPPLKKHVRNVPDIVENVYRKMVAKRPGDRFQSMGDVISALKGYDPDSTTSANENGAAGRAGENGLVDDLELPEAQLATTVSANKRDGATSEPDNDGMQLSVPIAKGAPSDEGHENDPQSSSRSRPAGPASRPGSTTSRIREIPMESDASIPSVPDFLAERQTDAAVQKTQSIFVPVSITFWAVILCGFALLEWSPWSSGPKSSLGTVSVVFSDPSADIRVKLNTERYSRSDVEAGVNLPAGDYILTASSEQYETTQHSFSLGEGEELAINLKLKSPESTTPATSSE